MEVLILAEISGGLKGVLLVLFIPAFLVLLPMAVEALEKTRVGKTSITVACAVGLLLLCMLPLALLIIRGF
jgi:hypothetical protein